MDRLPTELLLRCFSNLTYDEKLQALTVNKHWYETLQNADLYKAIFVQFKNQFDEMYDFFDKYPVLGRQVKSLMLSNLDLGIYSFMSLPSLFPELQKLFMPGGSKPIPEWNQDQAEKHFAPWAKSIQCIQENGSPIAAPALLKTQLCSNLVVMDLGFSGYEDEFKKMSFIENLRNAPNLTILKTHWVNYNWKDVEKIHDNTPHLKAISFVDCGFQPMKDIDMYALNLNVPMPGANVPKIKPALNIETLSIETGSFFNREANWIAYFTSKYVNMKHYLTSPMEDEAMEDYWTQQPFRSKQLVEKCTKLEVYKDHAFGLTKEVLTAMDQSGVRLKSIDLGVYNAAGDFKLLCKSDQKNYIESLTLSGQSYCILADEFKPKTKFIKELAKFPNLKHLRINENQNEVMGYDSNRVPLDLMLKELKQLETLTMDFALLEVSSKTKKPFNTKLKKLVLIESYLEAAAIKDKKDWPASEEYVQKVLLPNTEFVWVDYDDSSPDDQYEYLFELDNKSC
jgi:Leucine-rich repeat (LRR) protein